VQIEYFDDPESTARPVLLIYGNNPNDTASLQRAIEALAAGDASDVKIDALPSFEGVDGCAVTAQLASTNLGMTRLADTPSAFQCALEPTAWSQVAGLLEPFTQARPHDAPDVHQYLSSEGPIDWIVATSRRW
jgi:hypothetical protein